MSTLPGFVISYRNILGESVMQAFTNGERKVEYGGQKEKGNREFGHLQLLKRNKPLKCLSVN